MTLKEFHVWYIEESGRTELKTVSGRKRFIPLVNEAQKILDGRLDRRGTRVFTEKTLPLGEYELELTDCHVISDVYILNSDGDRVPVDRVEFDWMVQTYPAIPPDTLETPAYYCIASRERGDYPKTIWLVPSPSASISVWVQGKFKSKAFTGYADTSFWVNEYPIALMKALDFLKQQLYENATGMRTASEAMEYWFRIIDGWMIDQEEDGINQLWGW